jgi:hypothetical protein
MLRKIVLLSLPLFIVMGTVTTVIALERQRTAEWARTLEQYFAQTHTAAIDVEVQVTVSALQPWNFREGMGSAFLDTNDWRWHIEQLPFPPDSLYCVLVKRIPTATANPIIEPARQLLYVAHHSDHLWRVGWIVHEGPTEPFTMEVANDIAALGCDPKLLRQA